MTTFFCWSEGWILTSTSLWNHILVQYKQMSLFFLRIRGVDGKIVKNNFRPTQGINGRCLTSNDDNNGLSFISIYFGILGITINNDKYNMTKNGGWPRWWKNELSFKTDKEIYEILRNKISNFLHRETLIIYERDFLQIPFNMFQTSRNMNNIRKRFSSDST